ncbi:MAG: hypothetical protein U9N32_08280 [Spirochaetota bacterium]|nr:hypothetical protein [Spirochaetota bacterium]
MRKMKLFLTGTLIPAALFISLTGCPNTPDPSVVEASLESSVIEENSELFIEDPNTAVVSFETNDTKYTGQYGYTLWTEGDAVQDPFTHLNVTLKKISGNDVAGYGIIFGSHNNTMLIVLINTNREFIIGELTGNLFTKLQEWIEVSSLKPGYNQSNIIDISHNSVTGDFTLSFNGGDAVTFRDDEEPFHTTGKDGYMVVISPLDVFPGIPVSITFKKN